MFQLQKIVYKQILTIESLEIPAQQITCITGESGSGKTTFLKLLNRMITPDTGTVWYQGVALNEADPVLLRRQVVMLPQDPLVFPGTLLDNLQAGRRFAEKPDAGEARLKEMMEMVSLSKRWETDPHSLSGGEKQRLSLARLLLMDADVLLLDEPSAALDDETETLVVRRIVDYVRTNEKTMVMVTHSKALARSVGERQLLFQNGTISSGVPGGGT